MSGDYSHGCHFWSSSELVKQSLNHQTSPTSMNTLNLQPDIQTTLSTPLPRPISWPVLATSCDEAKWTKEMHDSYWDSHTQEEWYSISIPERLWETRKGQHVKIKVFMKRRMFHYCLMSAFLLHYHLMHAPYLTIRKVNLTHLCIPALPLSHTQIKPVTGKIFKSCFFFSNNVVSVSKLYFKLPKIDFILNFIFE